MRKHPEVTKDDDGGLTIHDVGTGLVVSIISTHPAASGPHGLTIEVYDYKGRDILSGVPLRIARRHELTFYPVES